MNKWNTESNGATCRAENKNEKLDHYTEIVQQAMNYGHTHIDIIEELENEKNQILSDVITGVDARQQSEIRAAKLTCLQAIDTLIADLKNRFDPKEG